MKYDWLKDTDFTKIDGEYAVMIETIGMDAFCRLLEAFEKQGIYFSVGGQISERRIEYILSHPHLSTKELARILDCSARFIQRVRAEQLQK